MEYPPNWPEPIVRVQSLADSGTTVIPHPYVRPPSERPKLDCDNTTPGIDIPIVDMKGLRDAAVECSGIRRSISDACKEWGFFQVVNHGVSLDLMRRMRKVWKEFFHLPLEQKEIYANSPMVKDGYGSCNGVSKDAPEDWGDYFYLGLLPHSNRRYDRWPVLPNSCRETVEEYAMELNKLGKDLMKLLSKGLGLDINYLEKALGGEAIQSFIRVNFYPKCPQPELTFGLSPHTDGSALTILLPDDRVKGLQVRKGEVWVPVQLVPNALVMNVGDQIQVISNGIYKSVEHRAVVNSEEERLSMAFFFHPRSDIPLAPASELVTPDFPALYRQVTFNQYMRHRVTKGIEAKSCTDSFHANK